MTDVEPLTSYAQIEPLDVEWLWQDFIPFGTVTGLFGAEGIAKGYLESALASIVSNGADMPDGSPGVPAGNVVMIMTEDDQHTAMAYRLRGAGANLANVRDMTEVDGEQFTLPDSLPALLEQVHAIGDVRLVIMDALADISSVSLTSGVSKLRRQLVNPTKHWAEETGIAVIWTQHTTKDGKTLAGGAAIRQALRHVLRVERSAMNPDIRTLSIDKSNVAQDKREIRYTVTGEGRGTHVSFNVGAGSEESADELEYVERAGFEPGHWTKEVGQTRILTILAEATGPLDSRDIAFKIGATYSTTRILLRKLERNGDIERLARNTWQLATPQPIGVQP